MSLTDEDRLNVRIHLGLKRLPVPDYLDTDLGKMPIQNFGYEALNILLEDFRQRVFLEAGVIDQRGD